MQRVVKAVKGRIGVIAVGNIGQSLEEQATAIKVSFR